MSRMKSLPLLAAALLLLACKGPQTTPGPSELRTGDLIFVGIPADYRSDGMADAIADATGGADTLRLIHVAIVEMDSLGCPWVIDATLAYGVDRHPLDTMLAQFALRDGHAATYIVKRLERPQAELDAFVANARRFCGEEYDRSFLPDNGRHYCSELVRDAYRTEDGSYLFAEYPMNWKDADGEFPAYWVRLFGQLGEPIPQDVPGTNPQAMAADPLLHEVKIFRGPVQD